MLLVPNFELDDLSLTLVTLDDHSIRVACKGSAMHFPDRDRDRSTGMQTRQCRVEEVECDRLLRMQEVLAHPKIRLRVDGRSV